MSTVTRAQLRQRLAAHITTTLAGDGWSESPYPYRRFGREGAERRHLAFAVGLGASVPYGNRDRQRPTDGAVMQTTVFLAFTRQLRGNLNDVLGDADAAEDAALDLVTAVKSVDRTSITAPYLTEIAEPVFDTSGEWVTHDITFVINHRIPTE